MDDANLQQNNLMKLISREPKPQVNEKEVYEKAGSDPLQVLNVASQKLLTYHRYTISFTNRRFEQLGLGDNKENGLCQGNGELAEDWAGDRQRTG